MPPSPGGGPTPRMGGVTYSLISQTHDSYDGRRIEQINDLYAGGFEIMKKAQAYLPRLVGEGDERYAERLKIATYQPYFGQIVDQFVSDLFSQELHIAPAADADNKSTPGTPAPDTFYTEFLKNAERKGKKSRSFVNVLTDLCNSALKHRTALLCIDAPRPDDNEPPPINKADEEARGLDKYYVYECNLECLIDWETDEDDNLIWAIIRRREHRRPTPMARRDRTKESFTVWTIEPGGTAEWERWSITYDDNKPPHPDDPMSPDGAGTTSFKQIPIHCLELPKGLWVGNKIGPQALEHFRRRSSLIGSENRSLCAIPVAKLATETGAPGGVLPSEAQQDPNRGKDPVRRFNGAGYVTIGKDDSIEFAEPSGACYELVNEQLKELRDDMFAVNHQMAASVRTNSTALGRSGLSKMKDMEATQRILQALGKYVRDFAIEIFEAIAAARGDEINWAAHGLDTYEVDDRESVLEESISMDQVAIPSPTFRKLHKFAIAKKLVPTADPQVLDVIQKEIEDGVDGEEEMRGMMQDAQKDQIAAQQAQSQEVQKNPAGVQAPKAPGAKAPAAKGPPAPKAKPPQVK